MSTKALQGLRVLNTRPKEQAKLLSNRIRMAGGLVIECPSLEITPLDYAWFTSLPNLNQVHKAIFISANAVRFCFEKLQKEGLSWPKTIEVIAIGQASKQALKQYRIQTCITPSLASSEDLLELQALSAIKNQSVLLFKGEGGRTLIESTLLQRGANLYSLPVYQRQMPTYDPEFIQPLWQQDLVDLILITSEQSLRNLFELLGKAAESWLRKKPCLVISQRLAKAASSFGIHTIVRSHPDQIMEALTDYYQGLTHVE